MFFHRPQSGGPIADVALRGHQRPVFIFNGGKGFHHQACGANGAFIPTQGCGRFGPNNVFLVSLALQFTAFCNGLFLVIGQGRTNGLDQGGQGGLRIGGHLHIHDLKALEVLVI